MKKTTAIDYLVNHFNEYGIDYGLLEPIIKKAKEIHKEDIINAFNDGWMNGDNAEDYYKETFNQ